MVLMAFTKTVLKNLFSKPATTQYPAKPCEYTPRTRGKIEIEIEKCIFCGMCQRKCPTGAIGVERAQKKWQIERFSCIQCGACVEVCPKKCLEMNNFYTSPADKKYTDAFVQPVQEAKPEEKSAQA
ncbi:MAG TPA: 4Fe-4S ferredoxin [Ruminococcaceae bacterium]|nr:4Fe-4S ferredoxin [Oscillospiraceae bacterium]